MRFVKTTTAEKPHTISHWSGPLIWTTCGQIIDMGRSSVLMTERRPEAGVCGICLMKAPRPDGLVAL